ncbi:YceI family protein [Cytophagales bacterium RKSG123]|nr:YceI family protein [Xanthovirga aplysinae]
MTKNGHISFYSEAPLEKIEAETNMASSVFDRETKQIAFVVPISSFQFEKPLMQEHFNENYMETEKYPTSTFKGRVKGYVEEKGKQEVVAEGELNIHGVSRKVNIPGTLEQKEDSIFIQASFMTLLKDHKIKIPKLVFLKIAEEIEVKVNFTYHLYEN